VVVCVEAKWFDSWNGRRLRKKIHRAKRAFDSAEEFVRQKGRDTREVDLHFLKLSLGDAHRDSGKLKIGRYPDKDGLEWRISPAGSARSGLAGKLEVVHMETIGCANS